jgi:hypothetical protein
MIKILPMGKVRIVSITNLISFVHGNDKSTSWETQNSLNDKHLSVVKFEVWLVLN